LAECAWSVISKVKQSEHCEIKISFSTDHDNKIDCPYKGNSEKRGSVAHTFFPAVSEICGDIHFDNEYFTNQKTKSGDGKYNLFSVATHELGYALGIFHSKKKDSVMMPFHKHGFSTENK